MSRAGAADLQEDRPRETDCADIPGGLLPHRLSGWNNLYLGQTAAFREGKQVDVDRGCSVFIAVLGGEEGECR